MLSMLSVSVIICTHNPREDYLQLVLGALRTQTLAKDQWELLLVDNFSTKPLAANWDISWHPRGRHLREEKPGKAHALLRAIEEFQGELFLIVDDDNVLRSDYLVAALKISEEYPKLGAWSGSCLPEFEITPPAELRPWMDGLVIEKLKAPVWAKLRYGTYACPPGAGMVVRRKQALYYHDLAANDPVRLLFGPRGKKPGAGDDTDMALCGFDLGWGTGRFPELELTHLVPKRKLNLAFIEALHEGLSYSGVVLEAIRMRSPDSQVLLTPGRLRSGYLRYFVIMISLFLLAKGRTERRVRLAGERGQVAAVRDLKKLQEK